MSQWQRNLLEKKLIKIKGIIDHRKWVTSLYDEWLGQKGMNTIILPEDYEPVFLRYPILVKDKRKVLSEARKRRIEVGDWFVSPVHPNLDGWEKVGYQKGICPNAERICEHVINLPTHQKINEKEVKNTMALIAKSC